VVVPSSLQLQSLLSLLILFGSSTPRANWRFPEQHSLLRMAVVVVAAVDFQRGWVVAVTSILVLLAVTAVERHHLKHRYHHQLQSLAVVSLLLLA
jgi:hypothetical protein